LYTEYSAGTYAFLQRLNDYKTLIFQDGSLAYPVYNPPDQYLFGRSVYYKGAWILHMLRCELGDELFKTVCRNYFRQYKYENVTTADFIQVCEATSGNSWQTFFDQWLNYGGLPELYLSWQQQQNKVVIILQQMQPGLVYDLNLEIFIQGFSKDSLVSVSCRNAYSEYQVFFEDQAQAVTLDPAKKVLQTNNTPSYYQTLTTALLAIYPNPVKNQVSILYRTEKRQRLRLEIWNILGQRVLILMDEKQLSGIQRFVWNGINLAAGTYFCVLRGEDQVRVKKIVVLN
jgi:hypothetical protein